MAHIFASMEQHVLYRMALSAAAWPEDVRQRCVFVFAGVGANEERAQLAIVTLDAFCCALVAGPRPSHSVRTFARCLCELPALRACVRLSEVG